MVVKNQQYEQAKHDDHGNTGDDGNQQCYNLSSSNSNSMKLGLCLARIKSIDIASI